ncbi:MAG: anti-sigma regulatory factor [Clostridiales bacterium]|jgi:serine/threonine-protein kinase RsbT|nr:anti-sigma regulatory factor [Clostridiales bacterium]
MSAPALQKTYQVQHRDFGTAGEASADIKRMLRQLGVQSDILRRVSVAAYEAELNLVIHSLGGQLSLEVDTHHIQLSTSDTGPGIADLEAAMRAGFSTADDEARGMGFGAGMGLPNMKRNADAFDIQSTLGQGTQIAMTFNLS